MGGKKFVKKQQSLLCVETILMVDEKPLGYNTNIPPWFDVNQHISNLLLVKFFQIYGFRKTLTAWSRGKNLWNISPPQSGVIWPDNLLFCVCGTQYSHCDDISPSISNIININKTIWSGLRSKKQLLLQGRWTFGMSRHKEEGDCSEKSVRNGANIWRHNRQKIATNTHILGVRFTEIAF